MERRELNSFIFFLTLGETLPRNFYVFDRIFKELGFMLVPVRIDQLQTLLASTDQTQVILMASVTDSREMKLYNDKVRGLLKYVLKSKRLTFMFLSSFTKLNDKKNFFMSKNYYFLKYPLNAQALSVKIARFHDLKSEQNSYWPGGRRAGLGSMV